ncbi:TetR/AcrR family transcriptional regulator [Actinoplanes aureus]|uniref:TetR/AcrR family transcriptional regulator n=1 Tax=Actinoplanes aureus TaxID=2792083 RepID=A0A931CAS6_9ACTN|nr:TetR/AcrR family transcriptional regulator [Actinoplanes aureus]MBG0566634.1 TetR/AcrR family transcriptional regulator [Actinoplanes aureus]
MPRISAPTVAEHRSRQLAALLDAARDLITEQGPTALTLTALARRTGLSRPGLYEYFRSREELVTAIVEDELPRAAERIREALRDAGPDLAAQIRAYVYTQAEMMGNPRHAAVSALAVQALPATHIQRILDGHGVIVTPLADALTRAGIPDAELRAELVQAVVDAAGRRIQQQDPGTDSATAGTAAVVDAAVAQILHGLTPAKPPRRRRNPPPSK